MIGQVFVAVHEPARTSCIARYDRRDERVHFARADYVAKFRGLAADVVEAGEIERFLDIAQRLPELTAAELSGLTVTATGLPGAPKGLF